MKKRLHKILEMLSGKFRLVLFNSQSYEKVATFRFRLRNLLMGLSFLFILLFATAFLLILYTPIKSYLPGFDDVRTAQQLELLLSRTDSLEYSLKIKRQYIENLRNVFQGNASFSDFEISEVAFDSDQSTYNWEDPSFLDSLSRSGIDVIEYQNFTESFNRIYSISQLSFREPPMQGIVTDSYNPEIRHYAADIVAPEGTYINAPLDGKVVFAEWSSNTGYVIALQHPGNLLTVYKHNESLLQDVGDFVKTGEPIAVIGGSGELATGPHLHFEMWYRGRPLDPELFFAF